MLEQIFGERTRRRRVVDNCRDVGVRPHRRRYGTVWYLVIGHHHTWRRMILRVPENMLGAEQAVRPGVDEDTVVIGCAQQHGGSSIDLILAHQPAQVHALTIEIGEGVGGIRPNAREQ